MSDTVSTQEFPPLSLRAVVCITQLPQGELALVLSLLLLLNAGYLRTVKGISLFLLFH